LPTRRACGYNPTGSGAFEDSIFSDDIIIGYKIKCN
jgi:hypothetical protein